MMVLCRKLIINWLIRSKAINEDERELYEYALYCIVLLLSPAIFSIAIGCIMGIPLNGITLVMPFLFLRKFSGGFHAKHAWTCFVGSSMLVAGFLWISTKINCGVTLYMATTIAVIELGIFSPIQSDNRTITEKEKRIYRKIVELQLAVYIIVAIIANVLGKDAIAVCMLLGIIITALMQLPCIVQMVLNNRRDIS